MNMLKSTTVLCEVFTICFLVINVTRAIGSGEINNAQNFCPDFQPQKSLDLDQLKGMWYGIELIQHRSDQGHSGGSRRLETCPILHFARFRPSELQLLWHEHAGTVEYQFHIPQPQNPGFWMSFGPQNGTLTQNNKYRQFAGTVQVMKAVMSHMVLTFCSPNSQLFSIILSRFKDLDKIEVRGVRNMLQRRSLHQFGISETNCYNVGSMLMSHVLFVPLVLLSAFLVKRYIFLQ